jgi:excisionase family DNA binding protein
MARIHSTHDIAEALNVSEQTVRYHARKGTLAYDVTPGGHRRFDLDEVRAALHSAPAERFPPRGSRIDLTAPSRALVPGMAIQLAATSAYDEAAFEPEDERLELPDFMDAFAVPGSARYPQQSHAVGTGA